MCNSQKLLIKRQQVKHWLNSRKSISELWQVKTELSYWLSKQKAVYHLSESEKPFCIDQPAFNSIKGQSIDV